MKSLGLSGTKRAIGTKDAKKLRADGQVPCVIYGGDKNIHFSVDSRAMDKFIYTPNVFRVQLEIEGEKIDAVIKDTQFHPVTEATLHVDFVQLFEDRPAVIAMPVVLIGNAIGVRNGGTLSLRKRRMKLKGLPSAIPDDISIDIEALKIGQSIKVADVAALNPKLEFAGNPNDVVVAVKTSRAAIEDEEEEEGAEGETTEGGEGSTEGGEAKKEEAPAES
ncbi:MAG: 50S ribosomal protein L25 [Flavobacteriales bacterium]|nr:50S ribosomal protein L25 [Flavobacteriales bacterium]